MGSICDTMWMVIRTSMVNHVDGDWDLHMIYHVDGD